MALASLPLCSAKKENVSPTVVIDLSVGVSTNAQGHFSVCYHEKFAVAIDNVGQKEKLFLFTMTNQMIFFVNLIPIQTCQTSMTTMADSPLWWKRKIIDELD